MSADRSVAVEMLGNNVAALLPKARRKPLPLSCKGKTAAFLVSARDYEKMTEAEEDSYWLAEVAKVRAENKKNPPKESIAVRAQKARKLLDDILAS